MFAHVPAKWSRFADKDMRRLYSASGSDLSRRGPLAAGGRRRECRFIVDELAGLGRPEQTC
jgi:hypothetical protein